MLALGEVFCCYRRAISLFFKRCIGRAVKSVFLASISFSAYDYLPYPVGVLISYCNKDPRVRAAYTFLTPEFRGDALEHRDFHENLKKADFLGLTNWVWNQSYNDKVAKIYKSYRPDGVLIYGGTNVPENRALAKDYAAERPYVDIFFCGPSEEFFRKFLIDYPEKGLQEVEGTFTHHTYQVVQDKNQYKAIGIPSPYLDGIFDELIAKADRPLTAIFETNRGCPYRCSFCDWGGVTRSKIVRADTQLVKDTISYIMSKENIEQIEIADANFGIFDVDVEYMEHLVDRQKARDKKINLVFGGVAKNGSPYVEKILEMMYQNFEAYHGRKYVKLSFQSHDREVLDLANRSNLKNERLFSLAKRFQDRGVMVDAEMIIGLPGETQAKWLQTIQTNMNLKMNHQKSFVLFVVANTELANPAYQKKHGIKTKKILVPLDLYKLRSEAYHQSRRTGPIVSSCDFQDPAEYQTLEFIYECFSYDAQELMKIYEVFFWFNTLYNTKIARQWMLESPKSAAEQYADFMENIDSGRMPFFQNLLKEYRYAVWNTLIKPEPVTRVTDLFLANFVVKFGFRGNEVMDIYENQSTALAELRLVYPEIDFNHFADKSNLKDRLRLYFVAADVT